MKHQKAIWSLRQSILIDALFDDGDTLLHMYSHPHTLCGSLQLLRGHMESQVREVTQVNKK